VALAHEALAAGEVPVGAVVVDHDRIVSEGAESIKARLDPSAHAELNAIQAACRVTRSLSLAGLTLYSTVEPCVLCAYVIRVTGIARVVFGMPAGRLGGATSSYPLLLDRTWPVFPPPQVTAGILADECAAVMQAFSVRRGGPASPST